METSLKICPHFGKCGGCKYLDISYNKQIEMKKEFLSSIFNEDPKEMIRSPKIYYYRNRMDYVVGPNYSVGLKERGKWWAYVDIYECLLQSEESNKIRNLFREFIKSNNLQPWDTKNHTGFVRYIVIREGKFTGERMVHIVTYKTDNIAYYKKIFSDFVNEIEDLVTSVYWGINPDLADVSYSKEKYLLYGNKYLREKLSENIYYILPNTFFQTNSYTAEILIKKVIEFSDIKSVDVVYDLYSGIGTFSIELAKYAKEVYGVEFDSEAEKLFYLNAKENRIQNVKFINSKVEHLGKIESDVIVLDPPRAGMHPKAVKLVGKSNARQIIYVSCNPKTQYRDIKQLKRYGYELEFYIGIDQFPHTPHIETIAVLYKRDNL